MPFGGTDPMMAPGGAFSGGPMIRRKQPGVGGEGRAVGPVDTAPSRTSVPSMMGSGAPEMGQGQGGMMQEPPNRGPLPMGATQPAMQDQDPTNMLQQLGRR